MHTKNIVSAGIPAARAEKALIMLHGRGSTAEDILSLADYLETSGYALLAPRASENSWYPYSFLAPPRENEPWLSSAVGLIADIMEDLNNQGIPSDRICILGFSQGACLALEYAARNAARFGGIMAFTGGLIGDRIYYENYKGDFHKTPVFIGTGDPDFHVPVERVNLTAEILRKMNAEVTLKIYKNMGHTVNQDEINLADNIIKRLHS